MHGLAICRPYVIYESKTPSSCIICWVLVCVGGNVAIKRVHCFLLVSCETDLDCFDENEWSNSKVPHAKSNWGFFTAGFRSLWSESLLSRALRLSIALSVYSWRGGSDPFSPSLCAWPRMIYQPLGLVSKITRKHLSGNLFAVTLEAHLRSACWQASLISLPDILNAASPDKRTRNNPHSHTHKQVRNDSQHCYNTWQL